MLDDAVCLVDAEFAGEAEVGTGLGGLAVENAEDAAVEEGLRESGAQTDGLGEVVDGGLVLMGLEQGVGTVVVGFGKGGGTVDGRGQHGDGGLVLLDEQVLEACGEGGTGSVAGDGDKLVVGHGEWGQQPEFGVAVLYLSPIFALVVLFLGIVNDEFLVFVEIDFRLFAGRSRAAGSGGIAVAVGNLLAKDVLFVALCSAHIADAATGLGTSEVALMEVGIGLDEGGVIADGASVVACLHEQFGAVVEGHHVVGVDAEDEVEVFDGGIVVSHLGTQQTAVVVGDEVRGVEVYGEVVVGHRSAQVLTLVASEGSLNDVLHVFGLKADGLGEQ